MKHAKVTFFSISPLVPFHSLHRWGCAIMLSCWCIQSTFEYQHHRHHSPWQLGWGREVSPREEFEKIGVTQPSASISGRTLQSSRDHNVLLSFLRYGQIKSSYGFSIESVTPLQSTEWQLWSPSSFLLNDEFIQPTSLISKLSKRTQMNNQPVCLSYNERMIHNLCNWSI